MASPVSRIAKAVSLWLSSDSTGKDDAKLSNVIQMRCRSILFTRMKCERKSEQVRKEKPIIYHFRAASSS